MIMRRGRKAGIVIETIIILIGLGLLIKAAMIGTDNYRFVHLAQTTDGVVTGVSNYGFTLSVQITPSADEGVVFLQNGLFFGHQTGEHVMALYDPANPNHAAMANFTALWFDTAVRALAGLILAVWGFSMRAARSL